MKHGRIASIGILGAALAGTASAQTPTPIYQYNDNRGTYTVTGFAYDAAGQDRLTLLGAMTAPAPRSLATQLKLPAGMGLVVVAVDPDSPAASALKVDDVLTKLDDQRLVDPTQLGVLVRSYKAGDEVTLTYWRDGAEQTARVKLVERAAAANTNRATIVTSGRLDNDLNVRTVTIGSVGAGGQTSQRSYSDNNGSVELTTVDGKKSAVVLGPTGEKIFSGPIDTEAELAAAPAAARARIEEVERKIVARPSPSRP